MGGYSFYIYNIAHLSFDCKNLFCLSSINLSVGPRHAAGCMAILSFFYDMGHIIIGTVSTAPIKMAFLSGLVS